MLIVVSGFAVLFISRHSNKENVDDQNENTNEWGLDEDVSMDNGTLRVKSYSEYVSNILLFIPEKVGFTNIFVRKPNKAGSGKSSADRIRFPTARYTRHNFPLRGQFINLLPQVPIYFDRRTRQTIIYSPAGGFSSGSQPIGPINMAPIFQPTPIIGHGIPQINRFTGSFRGGYRTNYGRFPLRKYPEKRVTLDFDDETDEEDSYESPSYSRDNYKAPSYSNKYYKRPSYSRFKDDKPRTNQSNVEYAIITVIVIAILGIPKVDKAALQLAVTELDRQALLTDEQFVFDYRNAWTGVASGKGGRITLATANNFPALIGRGSAMSIGNIKPCGFVLPHLHPRADELFFMISGEMQAGFIQENGGRFIVNTLVAGQCMVFPQGSIHYELNLSCKPAIYLAAFNSADPGSQAVLNRLIGDLPLDIVSASLGVDSKTVKTINATIPQNPALGTEDCRKRCGL
ncbi:hypothetical protein I4U23_005013 [Adineta vaga]|nr:hypothetical protein I4U23_005013 [Adineta vaga]